MVRARSASPISHSLEFLLFPRECYHTARDIISLHAHRLDDVLPMAADEEGFSQRWRADGDSAFARMAGRPPDEWVIPSALLSRHKQVPCIRYFMPHWHLCHVSLW